jgi:hypothetical protein
MKAIKIDIKQTWVDVPHGVYREAVRDHMLQAFRETGKTPTQVTTLEVTYFPMKVYEPGNFLGRPTTYLVKQDERKVFTDLLTIQEQTLNEVIANEVQNKMETKIYELHASTFEFTCQVCKKIISVPMK